ncbi:hypothetical protein [Pragia fontium]|uniref:hypothetical protein n=1 Tax=Pragia fontium TaxID=82985 RepID=UPI000F6B7AF9|nr:hypothetical protein [Pragia fontium]VEJ54616.1 Uncharacterised protein [Pragia fontium]
MLIERNEIDFKNGKMTDDTLFITDFSDPENTYIDEDILLVEYPKNFAVDVSFHRSLNNLSVSVIFESDWENRFYRKFVELNDKAGLLASIKEAIDIAVKG